ncbi:MAG: helix-turn-helix transcriptional regulator [Clostridia bacterium]|nr:helix-turn-helix transcriptional regulator [Clostridia bacterium]
MKTEINYQKIGRNIKQARKDKKETQRAVAEYLNIQDTSYSNLECGHEKISLRRVIELCEHFEVLPGTILNDCTEKLFLLTQDEQKDTHPAGITEKQEIRELLQKCSLLSEEQVHFLVLLANQMALEKKKSKP